jgi:hypothetical protein
MLRLLLREMPLAMLPADRRPARIRAEPLIRLQPVSLPGVVQREIDGVLAQNHRAPFEDSRTLMPCASTRMCPRSVPASAVQSRSPSNGLISLALPTEAHQSGNINRLPSSLGKVTTIESRGVSGAGPKRSGGTPERERPAALAGANGAKYSSGCDGHLRTGERSAQAGLSRRLRELARDVRRIRGNGPEAIAISKDEVACELGRPGPRVDRGRQ